MDTAIALANENIELLTLADKLINDLNDVIYANINISPYQGSVGKHFRHVLDFYQALFSTQNGNIDYDLRERSVEVETDREHARDVIYRIIRSLETIERANEKVLTKNNDGGYRRPEHAFSMSSIGRELQFLASHSVHHFAMIAMILIQQGYTPPENFGVAASTLANWQATGYPATE